MKKFLQWLKSSASDRFLLIIIILLLNLISAKSFLRLDLTSQKTYSLSNASKNVVKNLQSPLSIKMFFSNDLPVPYNNIQQYLTDLLAEYKNSASKDFSYQIFDMSKEENQRIAQEFGLSPVQVDTVETAGFSSKIAWMGLAITYGDFVASIDAIKSSSDIEYKITTTLSKIIAVQESKTGNLFEVGYITGHKENALQSNRYAQSYFETGSGNFRNLLSDIYTIREINLYSQEIPENLKAIIINGPKEQIPESHLKKIDSFIMNGGNAVFFVDGLDEHFISNEQPPEFVPNGSNINSLLSKYGISVENYFVMDDKCFYQNQSGFGKQILNWVPIVDKDKTAKHNPITDNLGGILFFCGAPINIDIAQNNSDLKTTVLCKSSDKSWKTNENIILFPGSNLPKSNSSFKSENLAVLSEGKFTSAFNPSKKSPDNCKIVVVGSSSSTTDTLIDSEGTSATSLFMRNIIDYINGNEDFCNMRTKGSRLDFISIKNERFAIVVKIINEFGLSVVVILIGFIVWKIRTARRYLIHLKYNPDDTRFISQKKSTPTGKEK